MRILLSIYKCISILAYTLSPKGPIRGLQNDTDFTHLYVLEPALVIYSSRERIAFAKVMTKPQHQDDNAGRDRACPHHRSNYCDDDGRTRPIFIVGVGMGQLVRHRGRADAGFLCRCE